MEGPGSEAGIRKGDVLLMINNIDVESVSQFEEILAGLPGDRPIPLLIQRRGAPTFLALKLAGDEDE